MCLGHRHRDVLIEKSDFRTGEIMERADTTGMPADVLIVEDDPIIALDFEDTILSLGVKTVRSAANVASQSEISYATPEISVITDHNYGRALRKMSSKISRAAREPARQIPPCANSSEGRRTDR